MAAMFDNCSSLTSLNVTGWDTSKVTNMQSMFSGCSSITSLDLKSFTLDSITRSSNAAEYTWIFYGLTSIEEIDIRNMDFTGLITYQTFRNCKSGVTIYVKNESSKTFVKNHLSTANIIIPEA